MKKKTSKKKPEVEKDVIAESNGMKLYKSIKEGGRTLFLRTHVGTATEGKNVYEMDVNMGSMTPIITSKQTGRMVSIGWQGLLQLAVQLGIDEEGPKIGAKS